MASTTFNGPVRSENGFQSISINATTGEVTVQSTYGNNLTVTGGTVIFTNLPTADPTVAGQLWSNSGVLTVSAG